MDGMDEWRFVDLEDARCEQERKDNEQKIKVERKNTYCNIIRDYEKLREIAANIINALDIKDEEANEVTQYDIRALHVDDSHTTINIEWREVFDGGKTCQSSFGHVETVPAEWFALDESNLRNVVKSYKKQMKELIEGLKRDLKTAEENRRDADNRIAQIKEQLSNLEGY